MKRIQIFISSSERELEHEREIASEVISSMNLHPILFELYPALSSSPNDAFLEEVQSSDIFVLLLWKSLSDAVKLEYYKAIEKHKPILIFVKNLEFDEKRSDELLEFMEQFSQENVKQSIKISSWRSFRTLKSLKESLKDSVSYEISKFYKEPMHTLSREEMYDLGTHIMRHAQKRLFIFQRTPTLFLGLKNRYKSNSYSTESYSIYEKRFQDTLTEWIEKKHGCEDIEFVYIFDSELTRQEIKEFFSDNKGQNNIEEIKKRIEKYKKLEEETNYRFTFTSLDTPISGPLIIGDNRYAIWILGSDDAISFSQEDEKISSILVRMIKTHCQKIKSSFELFNSIK